MCVLGEWLPNSGTSPCSSNYGLPEMEVGNKNYAAKPYCHKKPTPSPGH